MPLTRDRGSQLFERSVQEGDKAVVVLNARREIVWINPSFTKMLGYLSEEVVGRSLVPVLVGKATPTAARVSLERLINAKRGSLEEINGLDKFGNEITLLIYTDHIRDIDENVTETIVTFHSNTPARMIQSLQNNVLEELVSGTSLESVSEFICRKAEFITRDVVSTILRVDQNGLMHPIAAPSLPRYYSDALDGIAIGPTVGSCGTAAFFGEPVLVEDIETSPLWTPYKGLALPLGLKACWSVPIKLRDGRVAGTFAFYFREKRGPSYLHEEIISACVHLCALAIEQHEAKEHIHRLAYFDMLTGLPNRRQIYQKAGQAIAEARDKHGKMALLRLDIKRFKDINDTFGHSTADQILSQVAIRLQGQLRPVDIVGRFGGDVFVIILPDADSAYAMMVGRKLVDAVAKPFAIADLLLPISISVGISLYPDNGADVETLLKRADSAACKGKTAGQEAVSLYEHDVVDRAQERVILGAALREAVSKGQLTLLYQPQVNLADGSLHGVEALVRWAHPVLGEISTSRFIMIAEQIGLIDEIGIWALSKACQQMAVWRAAGRPIPTISVNLSPLHLRNRNLPNVVASLMRQYDIPKHALMLEITEGVTMDDHPTTLATIAAIQALGVGLSMDDFGTGYSSLSRLTHIPFAELKIDRSFIAGMVDDRSALAVITAINSIGHSLDITVIAEGVETETQQKMLRDIGCKVAQGYLFSHALTAADLEIWMRGKCAAPKPVRLHGQKAIKLPV
ncbi:EAL domain-containing protein [Labrys neptuniae]